MKVTNPHDKFFKDLLSNKEQAVDFLKAVLPAGIKSQICLDDIKILNGSFIDDNLKEHFTDIVYTGICRHNSLYLSFLIEHKSYAFKYPHLQVLQYILNIWQADIKQKKELSIIVPIIVYHGVKKWDNRNLFDYFGNINKEFKKYIPDFSYILVDLSCYTDNEIKDTLFSNIFLKQGILLMKHIFNHEKMLKNLENILKTCILYLSEEKGVVFLEKIIRYVFNATEEKSKKQVLEKTYKILKQKGVKMTIAESLIKDGELKSKHQILLRLLQKKFSISETEAVFIHSQKDIKKLDQAIDELLFSDNKQDILRWLE